MDLHVADKGIVVMKKAASMGVLTATKKEMSSLSLSRF